MERSGPDSAESERPLISIVVCTFNRAHLLPGTIGSLLAQRYSPAEIVVLDDGSTDSTLEVLRGYGDRIRYASQPNRGIAVARTEASRLARGELIAFHDDDDPMPADRLVLLHSALSRFPEAVMAVGDWALVDGQGLPTGSRWLPDAGRRDPCLIEDSYRAVLWPTLPVAPHTTLFRKSHGDAVGWFDPQFCHAAEDKDFFARLALLGPVVYVPEIVSYLRRDPSHESVTGNEPRTTFFAMQLYRKHLETARKTDRPLLRRLRQRLRRSLEWIDRRSRLVDLPVEYFPDGYLDEWLPLIGMRERMIYRWKRTVRSLLRPGLRGTGRRGAG
ncbi:MAG: glycosyltransferase family 2 protein [Pseudomonadales bacterium]